MKKIPEIKDLEFLAEKSKEFIDKQISAYRHKHANAGSVIAIIALFIPFFLNGLSDSFLLVKIFAIIPIGLFLIAIKYLLDVLKTKSLDQGFHPDTFDSLVNKNNYEEVLLYEIGANRCSFKDNEKITLQANKKFNFGLRVTLISVFVSIIILGFNIFFKPENKNPTDNLIKELINYLKMSDNNKTNTGAQDSSAGSNTGDTSSSAQGNSAATTRVIPIVPPTGRINLNETVIDIQTKTDTGNQE